MITLRPFYVLTGTVQVQGGETYEQEKQEESRGVAGRAKFTVVQKREVSKDRRAGNVIATEYSRRVRHLRLLKTPFGSLIAAETLDVVRVMLDRATRDVIEFNTKAKSCHLTNCMILERLRGPRLAAVRGWISRQLDGQAPDVVAVIDKLTEPAAPPAVGAASEPAA